MTGSGIDAQLGIAEETVAAGTFATPTRFYEFVDETLEFDGDRIASQGIRTGRRVQHRRVPGVQRVGGRLNLELAPQGTGILLKHCFGAVDTTGVGPYTHTLTPGAIDDLDALTVQIGKPQIDGTKTPFSYLGCRVTDFELSCRVNELARLGVTLHGMDLDLTESLATASYPTGWSPFVFTHGSLTVAGGDVDVREVSLSTNNALAIDRHFMRSTTPKLPKVAKESGMREFTGSFMGDWESVAAFNRFVNGTEAALVLTFNAGADAQLTITTNVMFDGDTPTVGGKELLDHSQPFYVLSDTDDATAITAVLINNDSAP